ncbi:MAG TPA: S8 family serine peptidase, partial [Steroidobacteraceae bacterium]|nr:S8 family serine peptidase [Steroidobacteraceae bacterium]
AFTGPDGGNTSFFIGDSSYDDDDGDGRNSPTSTFVTPLDQASDEYPNFFGTSASAPHVAAVAALMLQKKPSLMPSEVRQVLQDTARGPITHRFTSARPIERHPITPIDGYNFDAGTGLVDAAAALEAVD